MHRLGLTVLCVLTIRAVAHAAPAPEIPRKLPDGYVALPFVNESGVRSLDWMRIGLPVALSEQLEFHPGLRTTASLDTVVSAAHKDVVQAAHAAHARYVWTGTYRRPNWKLEISVQLWSVSGDDKVLVGAKTARGDFSDVYDLLDDAIVSLCAAAGHPLPPEAGERLARLPTKDFYAFTLYGRGLMSLVGVDGLSDPVKAE